MKNKSVIIGTVTYNEERNIYDFAKTIKNQTYENLRVVIFDNNSKDKTILKLNRYLPNAVLIKNDKNIGFASGMNIIFKEAKKMGADYFFTLNNDIKMNSTCVSNLVDFINRKKSPIVGPIILKWDKTEDIIQEFGGKLNSKTGKVIKNYYNKKISNKIPKELKVSFVGGGISFINCNKIPAGENLFDRRYFMYYDESDLNYRFLKKGYDFYVTRNAIVWHKIHRRSRKQKLREMYYLNRNKYIFNHKHKGLIKCLNILLSDIIKLPKFIYQLKKSKSLYLFKIYIIALVHGIFNIFGKYENEELY